MSITVENGVEYLDGQRIIARSPNGGFFVEDDIIDEEYDDDDVPSDDFTGAWGGNDFSRFSVEMNLDESLAAALRQIYGAGYEREIPALLDSIVEKERAHV
jgi:hypothetical protein